MSRDCVIHAYDDHFEPILETPLAEAPEILDLRKRFEISDISSRTTEGARHALETARAALSGPEETFSFLQTDLGTVRARYEDTHGRLEKLRDQLANAQEELSLPSG